MRYEIHNTKDNKSKFVCFESFGVRIGIVTDYVEFLERFAADLEGLLPVETISTDRENLDFQFLIKKHNNGSVEFYRNAEFVSGSDSVENVYKFFVARIRLTVAEFAKSKVFLHAGVVGWDGRVLVFPGNSFGGKTTLVRELIRRGATYYSDEYAVLDEDGMCHPFPKTISVREQDNEFFQKEIPLSDIGAEIADSPAPVGLILITSYEKDGKWKPMYLNGGEAVLKTIPFTIPINASPDFSLSVLKAATKNAVVMETPRGEASEIADILLRDIAKRSGARRNVRSIASV